MEVNPYIRRLLIRVENRFSEDALNMPMSEWIERNTTIRGRPFSFKGYEFQRKILDDMHPNMDVRKCSQVGLTEGQIRKCLGFLVRNRGVSAIFTFPDEKTFKKNSTTRIKPVVDKDKVFNTERDDGATRNMALYQFGDSFLHVTGCTESDATSTPADMVMNDEVDISPQNMLALFTSRLQNSDWKINQRFSTPTFPTYGIDSGFQVSDQHYLLTRCDTCGHWNNPEFTRDFCDIPGLPDSVQKLHEIDDAIMDEIDVMNSRVVCEKCRSPLDLGNPEKTEWVAKYPGRTHARGYQVTPFCTSRLPLRYILTTLQKYKRHSYLRGFYNTVLGLPYSDGNIRLERDVIEKCFTHQMTVPVVGRHEYVWVGIDVGQTCHLVLARGSDPDNLEIFLFETVHIDRLVQRVEDICKDYNVVGGAIDRHPYEPTADEVFAVSKGKIVPAEYRGSKEVNIVFNDFEEMTHAQVDRTMALDEVVRQVKRGTVRFSGYQQHKSVIIDHLMGMVRDEQPDKPASWLKIGEDHFFHALGSVWASMKIKDVERVKRKDDIRSMSLTAVTNTGDALVDVYGRKIKVLDVPVLG